MMLFYFLPTVLTSILMCWVVLIMCGQGQMLRLGKLKYKISNVVDLQIVVIYNFVEILNILSCKLQYMLI